MLVLELRSMRIDVAAEERAPHQFAFSLALSASSSEEAEEQSPLKVTTVVDNAVSELDDMVSSLNAGFDEFDLTPHQSTPVPKTRQPSVHFESVTRSSPTLRITPTASHAKSVLKSPIETTALKCVLCDVTPTGKFVKINSTTVYHSSCFKCQYVKHKISATSECGRLLTLSNFTLDGILYCKACFTEASSSKCDYCKMSIKGKCIHALGKLFHPYHFFCAQCGKPFESVDVELKYMEHEGQAYCEEDFLALFANVCGGCGLPIAGQVSQAIDKKWHPRCLKCQHCPSVFNADEDIFGLSGVPFCQKHYYDQVGSVCAGCKKEIVGKCVNALGKRYHMNCFRCTFCKSNLNGEAFKGNNSLPYCIGCDLRIYG